MMGRQEQGKRVHQLEHGRARKEKRPDEGKGKG